FLIIQITTFIYFFIIRHFHLFKQFLILVLGLNLHAVTAYSNGEVTPACTSMTPNHRNNPASILEPPYRTGPVGTFTVTGSDAQLLNCGTTVRCLFKNEHSVIICLP
uniref:Uncharacterized protein n=1 Tax=Sinocyclocheilus rhinocerous TaxID=307959 RepID=A0A673H109_9TELE